MFSSNGVSKHVSHDSHDANLINLLGEYGIMCTSQYDETILAFYEFIYEKNKLSHLKLLQSLHCNFEILRIEVLYCHPTKFTLVALVKNGWKEISISVYKSQEKDTEIVKFQLLTQLESSHSATPRAASWSRNGAEYAVTFSDGAVQLHSYVQHRDTAQFYPYGKLDEPLTENSNFQLIVSLSPDGSRFTTLCPQKKRATLWRTSDLSEIFEFSSQRLPDFSPTTNDYVVCLGQFARVEGVAYSYNYVALHSPIDNDILSTRPSYLVSWEASKAPYKPKCIARLPIALYTALSITSEGRYVAVGDADGSVSIYILFSLQRLHTCPKGEALASPISSIEFLQSRIADEHSNDLELLSFTSERSALLWHSVPSRQSVSVVFIVVAFIIAFIFIFSVFSTLGI